MLHQILMHWAATCLFRLFLKLKRYIDDVFVIKIFEHLCLWYITVKCFGYIAVYSVLIFLSRSCVMLVPSDSSMIWQVGGGGGAGNNIDLES